MCYGIISGPAHYGCHSLSLTTGGDAEMSTRNPREYLPDVRDGLTHRERIVPVSLDLQQARGGRDVPTGMLYGTVVEYVDMSVEEMRVFWCG